ncbi:MAG TPA: uroporphyrinogen-III C-methyltransferase [Rhodanobacteraceae bacterium]|nr:uroporphyrinogen-III C-methyltransferase [Rhodanobacteraceae bacterium]
MDEDTDNGTDQPKPRKPRARLPGLAALAILVAIVALAVAAWSAWHLQRFTHTEQVARQQDAATIATLQSQLAAGNQQAQAGNQRVGALESRLDDLRTTTQGLDRRLANLETAYTTLSGQQQSGRDTLLLNDAEMLLRTAQQRYELFNDSAGALKAYAQAIEVLAQVQNPAYAPVRASAATERDALAAAAPPSRQTALDTLSHLRSEVATLPLPAAGAASASSAPPRKPGFWSRVGNAFTGIVTVSHDDGNHPLTDARYARQTLALDLAQAQEALLAFDAATYRSALQHADSVLQGQFDPNDAKVQDASAQLANLLAQHSTGPAPKLGGTLAQLQSLRASQPVALPAPATTAGDARR